MLSRGALLRVPTLVRSPVTRSMGHGPRDLEADVYKLWTQFIPKEYIEKARAPANLSPSRSL